MTVRFLLTLRGLAVSSLLLALLPLDGACDGGSSDGSCEANPVSGASCDPQVPPCDPAMSCGSAWICAAGDHQWVNLASACVISPGGMCLPPVEDAACSPKIAACPQDAGPCGSVVNWTCQPDAETWARSVIVSPCSAEGGGISDGGSSEAGSSD
jgi:hypothetical protein